MGTRLVARNVIPFMPSCRVGLISYVTCHDVATIVNSEAVIAVVCIPAIAREVADCPGIRAGLEGAWGCEGGSEEGEG